MINEFIFAVPTNAVITELNCFC